MKSLPLLAFILSGCCTLVGGRTQTLALRGPADDPKLAAGAGAVVLVDGVRVDVASVYAAPRQDGGDFGSMDLYRNADKRAMGYGISRIELPRRKLGSHVVVHVYKPGYKTQRFELESSISGLYWLNLLNLIGLPVDAFTGSMWEYGPEELTLRFEPLHS